MWGSLNVHVIICWHYRGTARGERERKRERECVCTLYINWQVVIKCADLSTISSSSPAPVTHKRLQQSESSSPEDHQPSLYLYIPLFPSPPLYLFLLPSSIQSLPLHPSSPFPTVPPDFCSHVFFTYWPIPPLWESLCICLSVFLAKFFYYFFTILLFRPFQSLYHSRSLYYILPPFFRSHQIDKKLNGCFRWKSRWW